MNTSLRPLAGMVVGGVLVAIVAATAHPVPALGVPSDPAGPPTRSITVSGSGSVTLVPDVARVGLGITVTKPTVQAARAEASRIMTAIIAAAKGQGIAEKDIRTVGLSLGPQYAPGCGYGSACASKDAIVGYTMSEQVRVTVRDLDKAGAVVDAATAAGATNVDGISFEVDDPAKAEIDARVAAIAAARAKAEAMAGAAGASLGQIISISESSPSYPVPYAYDGAKAAGALATPVQPGTQDVTANVTVVYELK